MISSSVASYEKIVNLLNINKILTNSFDLEYVLRTLVISAKELVETSDTIILYLYDQTKNVLQVAEGVGIDKEVMKNLAFVPGESLTGITFLAKKPLLFAHEDEIKRGMANISPENYRYYFKGVYEREIRSAFCVPLLYQQECLGILVVDNFENDNHFTEDDMSIIEIIADQSAIAIMNARLVQNLQEKNEQLSSSLDIHGKFTQLVLAGSGIEQILALLSRILHCEATYQDTIDSDHSEYFFPIIRGKENLGYIRLKRVVKSMSALESIALEHAATAMALELVKQNALFEKELYLREAFFQEMIGGLSLFQLKKIASQLGWDPEWEFSCMVIEGKKGPLWEPDSIMDKEKFIKSVENIIVQYSNSSIVFTKAYQTIVVIPFLEEETLKKIAKSIEEKWKKNKDILFGVGRKTLLSNIANSYYEAKEATRYGKKREGQNFISYAKLGVERLWQKVDPTTLEYFVMDKLGPVLMMGEEYFETLSVLIKMNKKHKDTARALHIHPNTLYYRLKKIEQSLDISLDNKSDWLNLMLAYEIYVSNNKK